MSEEQVAPEDEVTEEASSSKGTRKEAAPKRNTVAYDGKILSASSIPEKSPDIQWRETHPHDWFAKNTEVEMDDYQDMQQLNQAINRTRRRIFHAKRYLDESRRKHVETQVAYRHAFNRALIGMSGGDAKVRQAYAEVFSENEHSAMMIAQSEFEELKNLSYTLARELDALKTLADNLRKQMSIMQ